MSGTSDPPVTGGSVSVIPIVKSSSKGGKKLPKFHWSTDHRKLLRTILLSVKSVVDEWKRFVIRLLCFTICYMYCPFNHSSIIPPFIHHSSIHLSIHSVICSSSNPFIHVSIPPLSSDTDTVDNLTHKHNAHLVLNTVQIIVLVVDSLLSLVGGIKSLVTECCQISMKRKKSSKREVRLSLT